MVLMALLVSALLAGSLRWHPVHPRRRRPRHQIDVLLVARLLTLAISAGHPLGTALQDVRARLPESARPAVDDVLARARSAGLARSLAETTGPLDELAGRLARAHITGASVAPVLDAYVALVQDARRARAVEDARTIGVKLILPLTLLLLPGFIALVIAPFVLEQLDGLLGRSIP